MQGSERDFFLFLVSGIFLGISQSVDASTLNNYLKEYFGMLIIHRSALEFPEGASGPAGGSGSIYFTEPHSSTAAIRQTTAD